MVIKFPTLFTTNTILPGWDTLGHYYAFLQSIQLLQHGELRGYLLNWFGGMPLFYFYPPLAFWLMSAVALIFSTIPPILIFKGFILLSLSLVPVAFHFFVRSFLPKQKISILITFALALAYLFYQPYEYGNLGISLSGALSAGLLIETFAMNFVLFFLAYFKRLLADHSQQLFKNQDFYLALIFGTLIIYTHILSMIFTAFLAGLILLFYFNWKSLKKVLALSIGLLLSGAYILYPLVAYFNFSSGANASAYAYFADPLLPLLAFDPNNLLQGNLLGFNWIWFLIFIAFLGGLIILFKKQHFLVPSLFLIPFILIPRNYLLKIFPSWPIPYYRIMALLFFIYLTIAAYGLQKFFRYLKRQKDPFLPSLIAIILIFLLAQQIYFFNFLNTDRNIKPRVLDSYTSPIQYYNKLKKYPQATQGQNILKYFQEHKINSRVVPDMIGRFTMINFGSAHYFDTFLSLKDQTPSLLGLYAESAYQVPFLFPAIEHLGRNHLAYGKIEALLGDREYLLQGPTQALQELALFNVQYLIANKRAQLFLNQATSSVEIIKTKKNIAPYKIYKIKTKIRKYLSSPQYLPALYINEDQKLSFRNFSLGWYKMKTELDFPIIYDGQTIKNINKNNLQQISLIIIQANNLSSSEIKNLKLLHKNIVVLSTKKYQGTKLPADFQLIEDFKPIVAYYGQSILRAPNYSALNKLATILEKNKKSAKHSPKTIIKTIAWQNEKISFSGQGPIIINASYFPDWRSQDPNQEVYQVTPGQMLVFAKGSTTLKFSSSKQEKASAALSLGTIILIISAGIFLRKSRKVS